MNDKEIKKNKVFLVTYGCQMNVRDSEVICGLLKKEGYKFTEKHDNADIIIFNTCSVRQHAEDKVWSEIGRMGKLKTENQKPIIGLVGCMAQAHKQKIFDRAPNVDFVVGPQDIHRIPEIIKKLSAVSFQPSAKGLFEVKIWETDGETRPEEVYHTGFFQDKEHSFVVISEGCSNYCSYCVVPFVRGELRSRRDTEIFREIEEVNDLGISKITLLGQNVNAYKYNEVNFIELVKSVNSIRGLKEFSFVTSHPKDTSLDLFRAMAECEKLKKCLHLPVQSGSDRILKAMNRGYGRKYYLELVENYRKIVKSGQLTTDIIVGFPTETKEDFQDTYDLVKEVEFNAAYIFKYSTRLNTTAANMVDDIEKSEKENRHKLILDLQKKISKSIKHE